ncbi:putative ribonuclease H-like domain-containing protein, partial [Tanacetum coccineum]
NTHNIAGSGPNWLFDIDALTKSMNYKPATIGNQSNGSAGTKACDNAVKARMETISGKDYILLPLWTQDSSFSSSLKDSPDTRFKPSREEEKKDTEDSGNENSKVPSTEEPRVNQEKDDNVSSTNNVNTASVNSTNTINTVSLTINVVGIEVNVVYPKLSIELPDDPNMPELEDIVYSDDDEDVDAEADMKNLDVFMPISPIPTTRIHKDHPVEKIIRDLHSAPQTRRMTKNLEEHGLFSSVMQRINHKDFQNCLFACFLSQEEPKKVWTLVDLPNGKRAIRTKWVYRSKKDEKGIVIKNKVRLVVQGYTQEEGIDYDEEVYVCQPPGFEDPDFPDRVYKVEKALYGLHQAPRAWYETLSTYLLDNGFQKGMIDKTLFIRRVKSDILKHTHVNPKPLLKDADGKDVDDHLYRSMIGSLMYLASSRLDIMFAQTVVASSTTEAEYIAASNCCGQLLWIQNQLLDYGYNFMQTKIDIDNESTICIVKNPVFHSKTKHIEIRHHFIKDSYEKKLIQMIKIHTDQNVADLLTKAFDVSRFQYLIASIGMLNL